MKAHPHLGGLWLRFIVIFLGFAAINILAAHVMSDCGLPALVGADACADDVVRAG